MRKQYIQITIKNIKVKIFKKMALLPTLKGSLQSLYVKVSERGENYSWGGKKGETSVFVCSYNFLLHTITVIFLSQTGHSS